MKTAALCTQLFLAGLFLFSCGSKDSTKDETQAVIDSLKNKVEALEREQETSSEELSKTRVQTPPPSDSEKQRSPYAEIATFVTSVMNGKTNRQTIFTHGSSSFISETQKFEKYHGNGRSTNDYINSLWANPLSAKKAQYKVYIDNIKVLSSSPTKGEAQVKFKWINKAKGTRDYSCWPQELVAELIYENGRWVFDDLRYSNGKTAKEYLEDPFMHEYEVVPPSIVQ